MRQQVLWMYSAEGLPPLLADRPVSSHDQQFCCHPRRSFVQSMLVFCRIAVGRMMSLHHQHTGRHVCGSSKPIAEVRGDLVLGVGPGVRS